MTNQILSGRFLIVTGANQGLGLEIARHCLKAGASGVAICARDASKLEQAAGTLRASAQTGQKIFAHPCDVSKPDSVHEFVNLALDTFGDLDSLVNNAGIYGPKGPIESIDWDEWSKALEINLHGPINMCRAVLPHLKRRKYGKIVQLSGGGATGPMPFLSSYATTKAAVVRFIETLAGETSAFNIDANCIAPGLLDTRLLDEIIEAGPELVGQDFYDRMVASKGSGKTTPLDTGAQLAVWLSSALSDGITGRLISAVWDPWQDFPAHLEEIRKSDIYTLRRIVPKDRGMGWGDK